MKKESDREKSQKTQNDVRNKSLVLEKFLYLDCVLFY